MGNLPEWLKVCLTITGGTFAWGLVAYFAHHWVKSDIIEPIHELKDENKEMKKGFVGFTERVTGFVFDLNKGHKELSQKISEETMKMSNMFANAMQQVADAKIESHEAIQKANELVKAAEQQNATVRKMYEVVTVVHGKTKAIETEVKRISDDLIYVKDKKLGTKA